MALTDTACRNAKARGALYKLSDGGGLQDVSRNLVLQKFVEPTTIACDLGISLK
jgi:hypothetical protein